MVTFREEEAPSRAGFAASGFALMDCDGEIEIFAENRSDVFFYAAKHELTVVQLN